MVITQVEFCMGRTINIGNYENVKIDIGLIANVDEDEDEKAVYQQLVKEVKERMQQEVNDVLIGEEG